MEAGPDGENGLDVQSLVEMEPDQGQGHVTTPAHNMEGTTVQEVQQRTTTVTLSPAPVRE